MRLWAVCGHSRGRRFTAGLCGQPGLLRARTVATTVVRRRAGRLILVGRGAYIKWSRRVYAIDATREKDSLVVLRTQARSGHGRADFWPRLLRGRLVSCV